MSSYDPPYLLAVVNDRPAGIMLPNETFSPTTNEINYAVKMVKALGEAEPAGIAAIQLDGTFIDYPVTARARQALSIAKGFGLLEPRMSAQS